MMKCGVHCGCMIKYGLPCGCFTAGAIPGELPHSTASPHPYDVIDLSLYKVATLSTPKAAEAALCYSVLTASWLLRKLV